MDFCDSFIRDKHIQYIVQVGSETDTLEAVCFSAFLLSDQIATEHMRMSGAYWGLCALEILDAGSTMDKDALISWVVKCQNQDGGFGGNLGHDSTLV